jgi:plastocyanin
LSTTTTGTYIITVNATSGVIFHTVQVSVIVTLSFALNADFNGWNASKIANPAITQFRGVTFTAEVVWVNSIHDFAIYSAGFPAGSVSTSNTCSLSNANGCLAASAFVSSTSTTVSLAFTPTIPADDFTGPGTYEYYCQIHPLSMHGKITLFKNPDLAKQGSVNIVDLATIAFSFGSTPTSTNWNVVADLNNDGQISIVDLAICATYYGRPI